MTEAKHTPGPWVVGVTLDKAYDWPMFRLRSMGTNNPNSEEVQANARLIAAAPELLAACEAAMGVLKNKDFPWTCFEIEKVIAKAKGES